MPTLLRVEGYRFYFFSNERDEPPHVHATKAGGIAKIWLSPLSIAYAARLHPSEVRRMRELVFANRAIFLERWNEYFRR